MAQDSTSLEQLVLGYCRQVGALVEPPAYGVYEILLPDQTAARWGISPHQRVIFDAANNQDGVIFLHYGHALVETIVEELRGQSANGHFFINNVRPEKPGFLSEVERTFSLPNAKFFFIPAEKERARLHHYARFNFKVSLVADEKRELVLPVWMDLQKGDEDRRSAMEAKIAAINAEHESKLVDVEQKYHLRVQLELVNLAIITLPKLDLTVEIRKRTSAIKRTVSWNPLLHIVEPLPCDVCNRGGMTLHLCENGHLVHAECLAPQCVGWKRTDCPTFAKERDEGGRCAGPICVHSLTRCATCQRVTCGEHGGECHALDGEPRKIIVSEEKTEAPESNSGKKEAFAKAVSVPQEKKNIKRESPKAKPIFKKTIAPPKPLADYVEVFSDPPEGTITAYMIRRRNELAVRWWTMTEEGILVNCRCEKMWK